MQVLSPGDLGAVDSGGGGGGVAACCDALFAPAGAAEPRGPSGTAVEATSRLSFRYGRFTGVSFGGGCSQAGDIVSGMGGGVTGSQPTPSEKTSSTAAPSASKLASSELIAAAGMRTSPLAGSAPWSSTGSVSEAVMTNRTAAASAACRDQPAVGRSRTRNAARDGALRWHLRHGGARTR